MVPQLGQRQQTGNIFRCPNVVGNSTDKKQLEFKDKTACHDGSVPITCDENFEMTRAFFAVKKSC